MKWIKEFLFGRLAEPVCQIKTGFHTTQPTFDKPYDFGDWCKEFNVSMLHDRKPIYLN